MHRTAPGAVVLTGMLIIGMSVAQAEQAKPIAPAKPVPQAKPAQKAAPAAAAAPAQDHAKAMEAAMAKMQELGSPSEGHKALEPLAGNWTYRGKFWMTPGGEPSPMTGTAVNTPIFGGRFLKQEIAGQAEGMPPFEGLGFTGYDNMRKEYQSIWFDNMATGIMVGSGKSDAEAKAITAQGDFSCPMTGETNRKFRSAWMVVDADHNIYESYMRAPDGSEFKSMEIHYTRVPAASAPAAPVPCPQGVERC